MKTDSVICWSKLIYGIIVISKFIPDVVAEIKQWSSLSKFFVRLLTSSRELFSSWHNFLTLAINKRIKICLDIKQGVTLLRR